MNDGSTFAPQEADFWFLCSYVYCRPLPNSSFWTWLNYSELTMKSLNLDWSICSITISKHQIKCQTSTVIMSFYGHTVFWVPKTSCSILSNTFIMIKGNWYYSIIAYNPCYAGIFLKIYVYVNNSFADI